MPGMVVGDAFASLGFTWLLSLPMWGSMQTCQPTVCTILPPMGVRLGHMAP
jgi:hypothetical protein